MKKLFGLSAAAFSIFALAACSNEEMPTPANGSGVTFSVVLPDNIGTRAFNEGTSSTNLVYAVYDSQTGKLVYSPTTGDKPTIVTGDKKFDVTFDLVNGKEYDFMFWADQDKGIYSFSDDYRSLDIDYSKVVLNKDDADAFYNVVTKVKVDGASKRPIELRRPFAQINLGTDDLQKANDIDGTSVKAVSMTVSGAYTHLDLFSGIASVPAENGVTFTHEVSADMPLPTFDFPVVKEDAPYKYLAMGYVLTGVQLADNEDGTEGTDVQKAQQEVMDLSFEIALQNGEGENVKDNGNVSVNVPNCPVQRNYRTNIYGSLLTSPNTFNITIDPEFFTPDNDRKLVEVSTANELYTAVSGGQNVILTSDITTPDSYTLSSGTKRSYIPVASGKTTIVKLNGHTLTSNIRFQVAAGTLVIDGASDEAEDSKVVIETGRLVYSQQSTNVTLKNLDIESNVKTNDPVIFINPKPNHKITLENVKIKCNYVATPLFSNATESCPGIEISLKNCDFDAPSASVINVEAKVEANNCKFYGGSRGFVMRGGTYNFKNCEFGVNYRSFDGDPFTLKEFDGWDTYLRTDGKLWGSGSEVPTSTVCMGNRTNSAYNYPTTVNMEGCTLNMCDMYLSEGVNPPVLYVYANQEEGKGVTFNYDSNTVFNGEVVYASKNIFVNGVETQTVEE